MISFFSKIGNSLFSKIIFAALGISMMAFWGLGGITNTATPDTTAIQIGSQKISMTELAQTFDMERSKLSQLTTQYISPEKAIEMGLLQQTVQKKITDTLQKMIQNDLGLTASDEAVRKYVERHPVFKDSLGNFDRNLFMAYLSQNSLSEAQLADLLKDELANQHLSNTIRFAAPTSKMLAEMKWKHQNEQRDIEALLIETDKIPVNTQPTEEELKDYYEAYLSDFMIPETRDISVLELTPTAIAKTIQISQQQLDEVYESQKGTYAVPEKRHIQQIRFTTKEAADEAKKTLTAQNFLTKAEEYGQTSEQTDFGIVARTELLSELADIAFSAYKNTVLGPIETPIGWHLIMVTEIQPAIQPDKTKIYAEIKQQLSASVAYEKLEELSRSLEDLLGEGVLLDEAAKRLGLQTQHFNSVDITAQNLPKDLKNNELIQALFTLKEKETTALIEQGNGYLVAEVLQIHSTKPKAFEMVKNNLKDLWRSEQQKSALSNLVQKATDQMKAGNIPARLGQTIILKKLTQKGDTSLPSVAIPHIFSQAKGYENATAIPLSNGFLISVVKQIQTPSMDAAFLPDQMEQLSAEMSDELYNGFVADYSDKLHIKVNTEAIQKAFSKFQSE